jgi:hypothetical protein
VECDSPEAERELAALLGESYPVVPTFTGKRGHHRLFLHTADLPCPDKAVFHFRGIEFRTGNGGKGAQSVFPPSVHPDGPVYRWLVPPCDADPVPFPTAALEVIRRELATPPAGAPGRRSSLAAGEVIVERTRNDTLFRIACRLRRFGHSQDEIAALLLVLNQDRCQPPLEPAEVDRIAASAMRYQPGQERGTQRDGGDAMGRSSPTCSKAQRRRGRHRLHHVRFSVEVAP